MKIKKVVEFRVVLNKEEFDVFKYIVKGKIDNYEYRAVNGEYMFNLDDDMYYDIKRAFKDFIADIDTRYDLLDEEISKEDWSVYNKAKVLVKNIYLEERYGGYDELWMD